MKKLICFTLILCSVMLFFGCDKKQDIEMTLINNIIEVRNNIFAGSDESCYATFCSGERENPYSLDGVVNEKVPFGIITFSKNDNSKFSSDELEFKIVIGDEERTGKLEKSPYDNTYSTDIGLKVDDNTEIALTVKTDKGDFQQSLYNESKSFTITQQNAIDIAYKALCKEISNMENEKDKTNEVLIKILKDYSGDTNKYFWYIGIVSSKGDTVGILIDTQTGDIISKKI